MSLCPGGAGGGESQATLDHCPRIERSERAIDRSGMGRKAGEDISQKTCQGSFPN